jgi:hypothetical protein
MSDEDTGMADPNEVSTYVDETYGTTVSSMSPQDRAELLMADVNARLAAQGVPAIGWSFGASGNLYGSFDASAWSMQLNEAYFGETSTDVNQLTYNYEQASQTIYHEARHAEQTFRAGRERAGLGATTAQIRAAMQAGSAPVPPDWVLDLAAQNPILQCDYSQYQAEAWYESMYGAGSQHRRDVLTHPDAPDADQAYHALPEESDAWRTDDAVGDGYHQQGQR